MPPPIGSAHVELESQVLRLSRRRQERLHLVVGSPWKEAVFALRPRAEVSLWHGPPVMTKGDLILTVLDSRPRMLLCLERLLEDCGKADSAIVVGGPADYFVQLLFVPAVEKRLGRRFPSAPATLPDTLADEILVAVSAELEAPTPWAVNEGASSPSTSRHRSSGLQALVLKASSGKCLCCERDFATLLQGGGAFGLEVHHLDALSNSQSEVVTTSPERLVVVCGGCHNILHGPQRPSVDSLRHAWRHQ